MKTMMIKYVDGNLYELNKIFETNDSDNGKLWFTGITTRDKCLMLTEEDANNYVIYKKD